MSGAFPGCFRDISPLRESNTKNQRDCKNAVYMGKICHDALVYGLTRKIATADGRMKPKTIAKMEARTAVLSGRTGGRLARREGVRALYCG